MSDQKTLYQEITAAGIQTDHHESDLYFPVTPESTAILVRFPLANRNARRFQSEVEKDTIWYDVPFAFDPFWLKKGVKY